MKTTLFFLALLCASVPGRSENLEWEVLSLPIAANFTSVKFNDPLNGYAIGIQGSSSVFLKTIDGGDTWTIVYYLQSHRITALETTGASHVYIGGINLLTNRAFIQSSTDGGMHWIDDGEIPIPETDTVLHISANAQGVAVAACTKGIIIRSNDGFRHYEVHSLSDTLKAGIVECGENYFYAMAGRSQDSLNVLLRWNGSGWNEVYRFGPDQTVTGLDFISPQTGLVTIRTGFFPRIHNHVLKSIDGGGSWQPVVEMPDNDEALGVHFMEGEQACAFTRHGNLYILASPEQQWELTGLPIQQVNSVCMLAPDYGFAAGNNGDMLRLRNITATRELQPQTRTLFPNPATEYVFYTAGRGQERIYFEILDLQGKMVRKGTIPAVGDETIKVPVSGLPSGMYLLRTPAEGRISRFIKA